MRRTLAWWGLLSALILGSTRPAMAQLKAAPGDWPAWRGADRTGVSAETGLLKQWPKDGPKLLWKAKDLGSGYAAPAIADGKVYIIGAKGGNEHVFCLNARDGKPVWDTRFGAAARVNYDGARSTPTVDGDHLFALSSAGDVAALTVDKGKVVWKKNLRTDFGGRYGNWAYAESPLVDGDVVVVSPNSSSAALVALDKKTGNTLWKSSVGAKGQTGGYSSAIVAEVDGIKQYVQFIGGGVVGVNAQDGKLLWRYDRTSPSRGAAVPTCLFHDNHVFSTVGYGVGGALVKLEKDGQGVKATEAFFNRDMENHHGGVVRVSDCLYGTNNSTLVCVDFKTGKTLWKNRAVGKGSIAAADGHLYVRGERGPVALVEASASGYKEKGRFTPPDRSGKQTWPHPVIANGCLYLRDQEVLLCYDVKAKK